MRLAHTDQMWKEASGHREVRTDAQLFSWNPVSHIPGCTVPVLDYKNLRAPNETVLGVINGTGLEDLTPDSDGIIYFTSGTTGFPKAVLSTQRAGLHNYIASYIRESPSPQPP